MTKVKCVFCEEDFDSRDIADDRCIECWRKIALRNNASYERERDYNTAYNQGYMFNWAGDYSMVIPGLNTINPYDAQTQNYQYGGWANGFFAKWYEMVAKGMITTNIPPTQDSTP